MMDNNNTMEYRIGLEKQNKRNDQVTELILDNCRASQISGLTDEFVNLETLSLINVGLVTLKGFPKLPKLKKLELSDNRLTGGLNLLHGSPKLQHLNISGNRIKDLEALEPLKEFHDLVNLDLYNCEVTKSDDYRQKVFDLLPNLNSLDGYDRNECEVADSDESEDDGSDVENRIAREDNDLEEEEDDEEDGEEGEESSDYDEEEYYNGHPRGFNEVDIEDEEDDEDADDNDDDDDDEDDDEEDDDDDGEGSEEEEGASESHQAESATASANSQNLAASGNPKSGNEALGENGDIAECLKDDDDDDEAEDDDDGSDLKQLEKDIGEDEDSDDDDFEPTHEPDERDYEIDAEDDADEDDAYLSTSGLNATASSEVDDTKQKGQKRKYEEEGGDEVGED